MWLSSGDCRESPYHLHLEPPFVASHAQFNLRSYLGLRVSDELCSPRRTVIREKYSL